jgi:hypothetical protein
VNEEKRIYLVVAETVQTAKGTVTQSCSQIAAQCAHVVSMMRHKLLQQAGPTAFVPFTTIILSTKDDQGLLSAWASCPVRYVRFFDTNSDAYGPGESVMTALCTFPVEPSEMRGEFDHLPLWCHGQSILSTPPRRQVEPFFQEDVIDTMTSSFSQNGRESVTRTLWDGTEVGPERGSPHPSSERQFLVNNKAAGMRGLAFSWRRALGPSATKSRISRATGTPLIKGARRRKAGALLFKLLRGSK